MTAHVAILAEQLAVEYDHRAWLGRQYLLLLTDKSHMAARRRNLTRDDNGEP